MTDHRFESRYGEDIYPIGRLIIRRSLEMGLSRTALVAHLGYSNLSKGHRVLGKVLRKGRVPDSLIRQLALALQVEPQTLQAELQRTKTQLASEAIAISRERECSYHQSFLPYLRAEVAYAVAPSNPGGYFMQQVRRVPLKSRVWTLPESRRDNIFGVAIRRHHRRWMEHPPTHSKIIGYTAVIGAGLYIDVGIPFDIKGRRSGNLAAVGRFDAPPVVDPSIRTSEPSRCSRWNLDLWQP